MELGEAATIGSLNWITGFPEDDKTFFSSDVGRLPQLVIGAHSAITNRHYIDCTNSFRIGRFTTFAGVRSQVLTHSINLAECRQESHPVTLGDYCFVGTNCVLLSGSALPDYSVLGANSTLNKVYEQSHMLYAGTPARPVKHLDTNMAYFNRKVGFVH
jgi:acetyltransferase-like isoleucine patch superfamily enzyme